MPTPSSLELEFHTQYINSLTKFQYLVKELIASREALKVHAWKDFRREIPFLSFRFDYGWPVIQLAIEIQGGIFGERRRTRKGHASRQGFIQDYRKFNLAQLHGWTVLLLTPEDTKKDYWSRTLEMMAKHFAERAVKYGAYTSGKLPKGYSL